MNVALTIIFFVFLGFLGGCIFATSVNVPYKHFERAKQVCEAANSTPASLDWDSVICANGGEFPHEVK